MREDLGIPGVWNLSLSHRLSPPDGMDEEKTPLIAVESEYV